MDSFVRFFVDYCQYQVHTLPGRQSLDIYTVGDDLLHVGGPSECTGFAGTHTGDIEMRVVTAASAPAAAADDWDAVSETTLWCPAGRFSVIGLMGGTAEGLTGIPVPRGLIRVRVHARNRLHETVRTDGDPPEQHEIHVWPVTEETGRRSLRTDGTRPGWAPKTAKAAEWAMTGLVTPPRGWSRMPPDPDEDDGGLPRVAVVRSRTVPAAVADALLADPAAALTSGAAATQDPGSARTSGAAATQNPGGARMSGAAGAEDPGGADRELPAGDLEIRLRGIAEEPDSRTLSWRWTTAARPIFPEPLTTLPDHEPSTVRLRLRPHPGAGTAELILRHEGVLGRHAVSLGLIWDHLLDRLTGTPGGSPPAWDATLRARAAEATERAETDRRRRAEREAKAWGGAAPTERLRSIPARARSLARLDRPLLDRLAAMPAGRQREVARWAARRALQVAGLERIGWIADALAAVDAGGTLPASFTDDHGQAAFRRMLSDPQVPETVITIPGGPSNFLQQAAALPALLALAVDDPLAAAVDAVYVAATAHGDDHARFLADAHAAFPST